MADDMQSIKDAAETLGNLVAEHPAIQKYIDAQKAVVNDPEARQLMGQFQQRLEVMARNEQMGQPVTQAERGELERLQTTLATNLRIKSLNIAQVEYTDLLRKVSEAWRKPIGEKSGAAAAEAGAGGAGGAGAGAGSVFAE